MTLYRKTASLLLGRPFLNLIKSPKLSEPRYTHRWVAPTLKELFRRRVKNGPQPLERRSSFLEWNYEAEVFAFGKRLGEDFDKNLLKQALTHVSYNNAREIEAKAENRTFEPLLNNQQMIKYGEEIISSFIRTELGKKFVPDVTNAFLTYLTSVEKLASIGSLMGLKDIILTSEFPASDETLSNTLKAVVSALKLSQNEERAQLFIKDFILSHVHEKEIDDVWQPEDPINYLDALLKQQGITGFEPRLCNQSAMGTILANYQVGLYNNRKLLGIGWGESIEIAKNSAAIDAIHRIHNERNI